MPELIIKYKGEKTLKALHDMAKVFDFTIEKQAKGILPDNKRTDLPITFAKDPDVTALAGIWEGRSINLEELRKEAWGDRI